MSQTPRFCEPCSAVLNPGPRFCGQCGRVFRSPATQSAPTPAQPRWPVAGVPSDQVRGAGAGVRGSSNHLMVDFLSGRDQFQLEAAGREEGGQVLASVLGAGVR